MLVCYELVTVLFMTSLSNLVLLVCFVYSAEKCENLLPCFKKSWSRVRSYWIFLAKILITHLTDPYRWLLLFILLLYSSQSSVFGTLPEIYT